MQESLPRPGQDDIDASKAPLLDHLIELRTRLIYAAVAFFVIAFAAYLGHIYVAKHKAKVVEGLPTISAPANPAPESAPAPTPAPVAPAAQP